ncbi:MAG TPA: hypothetical protein PLS03_16360, partial [Terrimicrobiaceae bacterium]|nr:hypothetical protein [Terrimicrobiaceae bacterium]
FMNHWENEWIFPDFPWKSSVKTFEVVVIKSDAFRLVAAGFRTRGKAFHGGVPGILARNRRMG